MKREAILAWCQAFRTDPHAECAWPYFVQVMVAQAAFDERLCDLAEIGTVLLSTLDTE